MEKENKLIFLLEKSLSSCIEVLKKTRFDKENDQQLALVLFFARIIEYTNITLKLVKDDFTSDRVAIPIILRSILEAFVDFKNIQFDKEYVKYLKVAFLKDKKIIAQEAKNNNPYTRGMNDIDAEQIEKELALLDSNKKYREIRIETRFKNVDLHNEYKTVYKQLCSETHNNINALKDRYINQDNKVVVFENVSIDDYEADITFLIEKLIEIIDSIVDVFKVDYSSDSLRKDFNRYDAAGKS